MLFVGLEKCDSGGVFRRAVADLVLPSLLLGRFAGSDMMPTATSAALVRP